MDQKILGWSEGMGRNQKKKKSQKATGRRQGCMLVVDCLGPGGAEGREEREGWREVNQWVVQVATG